MVLLAAEKELRRTMAEKGRLEKELQRVNAENVDLRAQVAAAHAPETIDLAADNQRSGAGAGDERGLKRNHAAAELHGMLATVKREKIKAVDEAEDYEDLAKTLTMTVDERQSYEDELKQQLRKANIRPLEWEDFRSKRQSTRGE